LISGSRAIRILTLGAMIYSSFTLPVHPQPFGKKGGRYDGPPVVKRTPVDEKAYKAALERIPEPTQKYDPWGVARPSEPTEVGKK
jgi:hypothetical protein